MTYPGFALPSLSRSKDHVPVTWVVLLALPLAAALGGCAPGSNSGTGSGGSSATGGSGSGGNKGSGGGPGSGGAVSSGGSSSGGSSSTGGSSSGGGTGSGGSSSSGGSGSGGTTASGGAAGATASGGAGGNGAKGGAPGSGGGSMNTSACQAGPPTPASGGTAYPFPQHRFGSACLYPAACKDMDVATSWKNYKTKFVVDGGDGTLRVQRPENANDTVSEGVAYGMLFAVFMGEKDTFDAIWKYEQKFLDASGLMHWHINSNGTVASGGMNSATDSDEDMGFALVMADKQWGGYATVAKDFLSKVAKLDFEDDGTIKGGDKYANAVNPSYLAPAYYRTFAKYTGDAKWMTILEKSYSTLASATNATTGLVPDWSVPAGRGPDYKYDAARTPYRIALDACWNNEARAVTFSKGIAKFFAGVGAENIKDGYSVSGMPIGENTNSTFIGPAGVSGMAGNQMKLVDDAYAVVAADGNKGTESYFNLSWALFSSLMMTGNFVDLTQ